MSARALSGALGIDTSNYTTSAAAYAPELPQPVSAGRLLEVGDGGCGLRQSDAVFAHVKNLPEIVAEAMRRFDGEIAAVGVSARPRDAAGSYMPCFLTGVAAASAAASALRVPLYEFSHQANHVAAAAFAAGRPELLRQPFLAWHLSGGTSELLLVRPDGEKIIRCERVGGTSDLAAGQAIDRAGVMLGLRFPCGRALDALSLRAETPPAPARLSVKGREMSQEGRGNKARGRAGAYRAFRPRNRAAERGAGDGGRAQAIRRAAHTLRRRRDVQHADTGANGKTILGALCGCCVFRRQRGRLRRFGVSEKRAGEGANRRWRLKTERPLPSPS